MARTSQSQRVRRHPSRTSSETLVAHRSCTPSGSSRRLMTVEMPAGGEMSAALRLNKRALAGKTLGELKLSQVATPLGPLSLGVSDAGLHVAFFDTWWENSCGDDTESGVAAEYLKEAKLQVEEYFSGRRSTFSIPLKPEGTPFQRRAWEALEKIPFGKTISYEEQANLMNESGKARAVGAANGKNPICLFIPCHRVIAKGGKLCGYAFGLESKQFLLDLEQSKVFVGRSPLPVSNLSVVE